MKAFKAFIKLFEAPQRSEKIKIKVNFHFNTTFWNTQDGLTFLRHREVSCARKFEPRYSSYSRMVMNVLNTAQKMKFSIKDFFRRCDQSRSFLWICSYLLKKSLMENFIFCAVKHYTDLVVWVLYCNSKICANSDMTLLLLTNLRIGQNQHMVRCYLWPLL